MKLSQEELKKIAAEQSKPSSRENCPTPEDLVMLHDDSLSEDKRKSLSDHLSRCSECAGEFRLGIKAGELVTGRRANVPRRPQQQLWWSAIAAAIIVAALAGVILFRQTAVAPVSNERGNIEAEIVPAPEDGAILSVAPTEFSWSKIPAARSYVFVLYDFQSTEILTSPTGVDTRYQLPETYRNQLSSGYTYYWRVQYNTQGGTRESKLFRFSIQ